VIATPGRRPRRSPTGSRRWRHRDLNFAPVVLNVRRTSTSARSTWPANFSSLLHDGAKAQLAVGDTPRIVGGQS
jgi:hypothetical protein